MHDWRSVPVVDEIVVDGQRISIRCRRDYAQAKRDFGAACAQVPPVSISLPLNTTTKQVCSIAKTEVVHAG